MQVSERRWNMSDQNVVQVNKPKLERSGIRDVVSVGVTTLLFGVIMFTTAGRLDWWEAWVCMIILISSGLVIGIWMIRNKPEISNERGRTWENAKPWDIVIIVIYYILFLAIIIVAGLDARFMWSDVHLGLKIIGGISLLFSMFLTYWVTASNPFLATIVRIQNDRSQFTITSGPYRYVRHPLYVAFFFAWCGTSLLLGSWWALIPTLLCVILFIIRILLEERTLLAGLPGYTEYTQKVRYHVIPGIW